MISVHSIFFLCCPSHQVSKVEQKQMPQNLSGRSGDVVNIDKRAIRIDVPDIVSVSACADLTLPPGAGLCIDTINGPVFMVSIILSVPKRFLLSCIVSLNPTILLVSQRSVLHLHYGLDLDSNDKSWISPLHFQIWKVINLFFAH